MGKPKFICDDMLGKLARWLRMIGYDTVYSKDHGLDDRGIIEKAMREKRVVVTRDTGLCMKANHCIPLTKHELEDQLAEFIEKSHKRGTKINLPEAPEGVYCNKCNGPLREVEDKKDIEENVPEGSFQRQDKFWKCQDCNQVYWSGTHWEKIRNSLEKIRD